MSGEAEIVNVDADEAVIAATTGTTGEEERSEESREEARLQAMRVEEADRRERARITLDRVATSVEASRVATARLLNQLRISVLNKIYQTPALREEAIASFNLNVREAIDFPGELLIEPGEIASDLIQFTEAANAAALETGERRRDVGDQGTAREETSGDIVTENSRGIVIRPRNSQVLRSEGGGTIPSTGGIEDTVIEPRGPPQPVTASALSAHNSGGIENLSGALSVAQKGMLSLMEEEFRKSNSKTGAAISMDRVSSKELSIYEGVKKGQSPFVAFKAGTILGDGESDGGMSDYHDATSKLEPRFIPVPKASPIIVPTVKLSEFKGPKERALKFDSQDVAGFTEDFNNIFGNATTNEKFTAITRYVESADDRRMIKAMPEYKLAGNWDLFILALKKLYVNMEQGLYSLTRLEQYCRKTATTTIICINDLILYTGNFKVVSNVLKERKMLNEVSESRLYMIGFQAELLERLALSRTRDLRDLRKLDCNKGLEVEQILAKIPVDDIQEEIESILYLQELATGVKERRVPVSFLYRDSGKDLEEDSAYGSETKGVVEKLFEKKTESALESIKKSHAAELARRDDHERVMREEMSNMNLRVNAFAGNQNFNSNQQNGYNNSNQVNRVNQGNQNQGLTNNQGNYQGKNFVPNYKHGTNGPAFKRPPPICWYCNIEGHMMNECNAITVDVKEGFITRATDGQGIFVEGVKVLRSGDACYRVLAQELHAKLLKEGKGKAAEIITSNVVMDIPILELENLEIDSFYTSEGYGEREKKSKNGYLGSRSNLSENEAGRDKLEDVSLNSNITMSLGAFTQFNKSAAEEIRTFCLESEVEIGEEDIICVGSNNFGIEKARGEFIWFDLANKPIYIAPLGILPIKVLGQPLNALVDGGSMVTVMSEAVFRTIGLPLRKDARFRMKTAIAGEEGELLGVCENVRVDAMGQEYNLHVFVCRGSSWDFILGAPFLTQTGATVDYQGDGRVVLSIERNKVRVSTELSREGTKNYITSIEKKEAAVSTNVLLGNLLDWGDDVAVLESWQTAADFGSFSKKVQEF